MSTVTFDNILLNRIGFGKYQTMQFMVIALLHIENGAQLMLATMLQGILYQEWNLTLIQLFLLNISNNVGLLIGSLISGMYADSIGRKKTLVIQSMLWIIVAFGICIAKNIDQMIAFQGLLGVLIGLNYQTSQILITETTPQNIRGELVVLLQLMFNTGRILTLAMGLIYMESILIGNWRAIALCNLLPSLCILFGLILWVQESPRFFISSFKFEAGIQGINDMLQANNQPAITVEEIQGLKQWQNDIFINEKVSLSVLFNTENIPFTWRNYVATFLLMFLTSTVFSLVPFLLDQENKTLTHFLFLELVEIPLVLLTISIVDKIGRIHLIAGSLIALIVIQLTLWQFRGAVLITCLALFQRISRTCMQCLQLLLSESYNTNHRSLGMGVSYGVGRLAGFIAPYFSYKLYFYQPYSPFVLGIWCCIFCLVPVLTHQKVRPMRPLDEMKQS